MNSEFWAREADQVARALLGKSLIVNQREAIVLGAQGFSRKENTGVYKPVLTMQPGAVYCPRKFNSILLLIVTQDGGCVLIRIAEVEGALVDGPGRVAAHLHLTEPRVTGTTTWIDENTIAISLGGAIEQSSPPQPQRPPWQRGQQGIGQATLQKLMPQIVAKYLAERPQEGLHAFVNTLLEQASTEHELRRLL